MSGLSDKVGAAILVESNGMYRINIEMEASGHAAEEEVIPAGVNGRPLDVKQVLSVYGELTEAELDVGEDVREVAGKISIGPTPAMTRAQAVERLDKLLLEMGVVVTHPDSRHVAFRLVK